MVLDPSEERLKTEFKGVKRSYIPMHMILRIDEMFKEGVSTIKEPVLKDNIRRFPGTYKAPTRKE